MRDHPNKRWTAEEEEALHEGIDEHGAGKWSEILKDPKFAAKLVDRTNINLKDKWRNLSRKSPITKRLKISPANTLPIEFSGNPNLPNPSLDLSNEARCNAMVLEAISTINDANGSDLSGILAFIEERHEVVPRNFRKMLSNSLRLLVSQNKVEMTPNRYKIKKATKPTQTLNQEDYLVSTTSKETEEIASAVLNRHEISELERRGVLFEEVAKKLAESDNKSFIAAEAIKEAKQMEKFAEESETVLRTYLEIYQQCALGKEIILW